MDTISNGHAKNGKLRFQCKDCKKYGRQDPVGNGYHERASIRGLRRVFGVSRNTVAAWLKSSTLATGDGETNHVERFNNTLRQRLARFVRRPLSFSKSDEMRDNCLRLFLHEYNQLIRLRPS